MSLNNANGCCDDSPTKVEAPFAELRRNRKTKGLKLFDVHNPIPSEISDTSDIERLFAELKLVPFATREKKTGHALLHWYLMLAQLSPMNAACIEKVKKYVVGSRAIVERREDSEFDTGEERQAVSAGESVRFRDTLNEVVTFDGGIRKFHQNLQWSYDATGNAYVQVSYSEINGQFRFSVKYRKTTEVLYKVTKPGEMRVVAISPVWTFDYVRKNPPILIPVTDPDSEIVNWGADENGVLHTVFHLKAGQNTWYGRPESEGADLYKYREVQDSLYTIKQSAGNFVGQLIIEVEDDDPGNNPAINDEEAQRAGFDSFVERMEENYTMKGDDPSSVIVTSRPAGGRPMFVFQIKPNTNENWYKVTGEMSEQRILRAHGLTLRFMGFDASTGFSSDTFIADYVMNVEPVLNEKRNTLLGFTNKIITKIWQTAGMEEMNEFSINFRSPIASQIEQFKTQTNGDNNNGGGSIASQSGG